MSEALLCGECPWFGPCHIGDEIPDDACWNEARDAGRPFAYPAPVAPEPESATPALARALERLKREAVPRKAAPPREPRPPREKPVREPKPERVRTPSRFRKTPEEVLEIRRQNVSIPYERRWGPTWARIFGGRTPPVRSACLAGRDDLWQFAEARVAAGARALPSDLSVLHRFTVEQLRDPALACVPLARTLYPKTASANATASAIRRYRRVFGIDLGPDDAAVAAVRSEHAREVYARRVARVFGDREPPVVVWALAERPDLWAFAERALAAGFAHETVAGSCTKLAHVSAADLADPARDPVALAPGADRTARFLQSAIRRFRVVMGVPA